MDTPNCITKRCSRGEACLSLYPSAPELPATRAYFHYNKSSPAGFRSICIECQLAYNREQAAKPENKAKKSAYGKTPTAREYDRQRSKSPERREYERKRSARRRESPEHKAYMRSYHRQWYSKRKTFPHYIAFLKEYNARPSTRVLVSVRRDRRRARVRELPYQWTKQDWQVCLDYWGNRCAVCGRTDDFWTKLVRDHWQPITKGGATVPGNIVPLCHSFPGGEGGCNNSKSNRDPLNWLTEKYGKRKAKQIIARIEAYFDYIKSLEDKAG